MRDIAESADSLPLTRSPAPPPPTWFDIREDIAARVLSGSGIEIGGLHQPLAVPAGVEVRYVDRMTVPELREHYPELRHLPLVEVDVVDDGERLETIEDGSLDFIVANHFLEHCHDPITTIGTHLRKLAPGGALYYAVPDKRFTFDVDREVTPLQHMVRDYEDGPEISRGQHFDEWARYVYEDHEEPVRSEQLIHRLAAELDAQDYSIHTHVFTQKELMELILHCRERYAEAFDIEVAWRRSLELIIVLRKAGPQRPPTAGAAAQASSAAAPVTTPGLATTAEIIARVGRAVRRLRSDRGRGPALADTGQQVAVPLSILGEDAGASSPGAATWKPVVQLGGVALPALELTGDGAAAAYAIELPAGAGFSCRLGLPDGGRATVGLTLRSAAGVVIATWDQTLGPEPGWSELKAKFPARAAGQRCLLRLSCGAVDGAEVKVVWGEPHLLMPAASLPELAPPPISRPPTDRPPADRHQEPPAESPASVDPLFSVLMPVHDPDLGYLQEAIDSVRGQTFEAWQLCLSDDGSSDSGVRELLERVAAEDPRIVLTRAPEAGGIATATNAALALAAGRYVVLADHDDLIAPNAFELVAARVQADPSLDMLYSDEDRCSADGSVRSHLFMKPGWSPELFGSAMYTSHLGVYRRGLVEQLGGFRSEFDGSQDYDLALRLIERTSRVAHVPHVLYTWRMHAGSTASGFVAKPEAANAACGALAAHLERTGVAGTVEIGPVEGWYRVHRAIDRWTRVALLMPVPTPPRGVEEARAFAETMRAWSLSRHPGVELFLAGSRETLHECAGRLPLAAIDAERIRFCEVGGEQPWTALVNAAAREADSELLLLSPTVIGPLHEGWWEQLVGMARQSELAAAGGTLLGPHGEIDRGAVVFGDGWPLQLVQGRRDFAYPFLFGNFRALNGPVMLRAQLFDSLGGMDGELGELAIADLCLRAGERGLRSVLCGEASFNAPMAAPPAPSPALLAAFRRRWRALGPDPYFNPGYWQGRGDFIPRI